MNVYCHLKKEKINDRLTLIRFYRAAPFCYYPGEPGIVGYLCTVPQRLSVGVGKNGAPTATFNVRFSKS